MSRIHVHVHAQTISVILTDHFYHYHSLLLNNLDSIPPYLFFFFNFPSTKDSLEITNIQVKVYNKQVSFDTRVVLENRLQNEILEAIERELRVRLDWWID